MKKFILLLCVIIINVTSFANDAVYYMSGNQLIPITETRISVQKEILSITRQNDNELLVNVYYEFFNPGEEKSLLVGFEALPPGGATGFTEEDIRNFTTHPYMRDFTVKINGQELRYEVSHVESTEEGYYANGQFREMSNQKAVDLARESDFMEFPYIFVYHFNSVFKKGLNIVEHSYVFSESGYVGAQYCFDYVLTAANRWANHQIDDFTLNLDLGNRTSFDVAENFFKGQGGWTINGIGRQNEENIHDSKVLRFHIQEGIASFHKKNFHPEGELYVERPFYLENEGAFYGEVNPCERTTSFDFKKAYTAAIETFYAGEEDVVCDNISDDMKKILRNLPFAYRGYVFKTKMLQDYFESTDWYVANPDYVSDMKDLSEDERTWVDFWTRQQKK